MGPVARAESREQVVERLAVMLRDAAAQGAQLVVFPVLFTTGLVFSVHKPPCDDARIRRKRGRFHEAEHEAHDEERGRRGRRRAEDRHRALAQRENRPQRDARMAGVPQPPVGAGAAPQQGQSAVAIASAWDAAFAKGDARGSRPAAANASRPRGKDRTLYPFWRRASSRSFRLAGLSSTTMMVASDRSMSCMPSPGLE